MNYWLVKSEPAKYSWDKFVEDGKAVWDGIRNYQARNNLRDMRIGDLVLFYHSNEGKEVVGIAKVVKESYQDPTTDDTTWLVVEIEPVKKLDKPVTLQQIKSDKRLENVSLIRLSRLSVGNLKKEEFDYIVKLGSN